MVRIPESDWKQLRAIRGEKLSLVCERVLGLAESIAKQRKGEEHEAFLKLWEAVNQGDELIAQLFDDTRRSNAMLKLKAWRKHGLLSDAELGLFTEETREALRDV
jgi:hypothetical protein